jgi:hypothetical protein
MSALTIHENQKLNALENTIARGLKFYIEVGQALLAIRDDGLYRQYGTFEDYCEKRWNMSRHYAYRILKANDVAETLLTNGQQPPINERQARELSELPREQIAPVWESIVSNPPANGITAAYIREVVEETQSPTRIGTPIMQSSAGNEYYTPMKYVEPARRVMGSIDLDPASCEEANETVRATQYFTEAENGLAQAWYGNVWLNPPYGRQSGDFAQRLLQHYCDGLVRQAVLLVNANVTDTKWFAPLWNYVICFTDHRIDFDNTDDKSGSTHGSCFVYLGANEADFIREFKQHGVVVKRVDQ